MLSSGVDHDWFFSLQQVSFMALLFAHALTSSKCLRFEISEAYFSSSVSHGVSTIKVKYGPFSLSWLPEVELRMVYTSYSNDRIRQILHDHWIIGDTDLGQVNS